MAFDLSNEEITKVEGVNQQYLTDVLYYLTYLVDKTEADEQEDQFQEQQRKLKSRR